MNTYLIGLLLAVNDLLSQGLMKNIILGVSGKMWMILVTIICAVQPWIFMGGLSLGSMTILNLVWDLMSDILVTLFGIFYFKEVISGTKSIGVLFAAVAIILFAIDDKN